MDNLILGNVLMVMDLHNQMQFQQQQLNSYLDKPFSYSNGYKVDIHNKDILCRPLYYNFHGNDFGDRQIDDGFDDWEILDMNNGTISSQIKVEIVDEKTVNIICKLKKGYINETEIEKILVSQIQKALTKGYVNIKASASGDAAYEILQRIGFKSQERQNDR